MSDHRDTGIGMTENKLKLYEQINILLVGGRKRNRKSGFNGFLVICPKGIVRK